MKAFNQHHILWCGLPAAVAAPQTHTDLITHSHCIHPLWRLIVTQAPSRSSKHWAKLPRPHLTCRTRPALPLGLRVIWDPAILLCYSSGAPEERWHVALAGNQTLISTGENSFLRVGEAFTRGFCIGTKSLFVQSW